MEDIFAGRSIPTRGACCGSVPRLDTERQRAPAPIPGQPPRPRLPPAATSTRAAPTRMESCRTKTPRLLPTAGAIPEHLHGLPPSRTRGRVRSPRRSRDGAARTIGIEAGRRCARRTPPSSASTTSRSTSRSPAASLSARGRPRAGGRRRHLHVRRARRWGSSASRGAARRPSARSSCRLLSRPPGRIVLRGQRHPALRDEPAAVRREMQIIFQDPYASLNPRDARRADIARGARRSTSSATATKRKRASQELLEIVGLSREHSPLPARVLRRPAPAHRHRARARRRPELIVCDEPVSALDVSIQAQILNLLRGPAGRLRAHLPLHRARPQRRPPHLRSRAGHVPRQGGRGRRTPRNSTTGPSIPTRGRSSPRCRSRSGARPRAAVVVLEGDVPSPVNPPSGCRFHPALPAFPGRALRRRGSAALSVRRRPRRRLPLPARALADGRR